MVEGVNFKHPWKCHNETPLYNYMLIKCFKRRMQEEGKQDKKLFLLTVFHSS
jgi:hypothetical protein